MSKEIVLPHHLYQRIKASAGEHGGIGRSMLFSGLRIGVPVCAHGHAWGTDKNQLAAHIRGACDEYGSHPELARYLTWEANDAALSAIPLDARVSFDRWCELLNVKCGPRAAVVEAPELVAVS